jgi:hypothetical protein
MRNCDKFKKLNKKIKMYEKIHFVTCEGGPNIEDELLDPYNPKSIWAYMWFSDEELKLKRRRKNKNHQTPVE